MPKGIPPRHAQFKPGQSGNPGGKPKYLLSTDRVKTLISKYMDMSGEKLQEAIKDQNTPAVELAIAATLAQCIKIGDYSRLEALLQRAIGKVREEIEVHRPIPYVVEYLDGKRLELGVSSSHSEEE